jgi:hypothetical protein
MADLFSMYMLSGSPSTLYLLNCSARLAFGAVVLFDLVWSAVVPFVVVGFDAVVVVVLGRRRLTGGSPSPSTKSVVVGGLEGRPRFIGWGRGIGWNFSGKVNV